VAELQEHRRKALVNDSLGAEPVEKERAALELRQHLLGVTFALAGSAMPARHRPCHRHRVVAEGRIDSVPFLTVSRFPLLGLALTTAIRELQRGRIKSLVI
jgi:hypothetical protein